MRFISKFALILVLCICSLTNIEAQQLKSMEFRNKNITDILLVLAEASGTSIIPDETVTGTASFYFSESDFEEALSLFLSTYKLYYIRTGKVFKVSKISSEYQKDKKTVSIKGDDVSVESLVRSLSQAIGTTILYDTLPRINISVDIDSLTPLKALEIFTKRMNGYTIENLDSYFYIKQIPMTEQGQSANADQGVIRSGEMYSLSVEKGRFLELLANLFKKAGLEYSLMTKNDTILENMYFSARNFNGLLRLLLEQGNADFIVQNNVYYIVELQRRDIIKKLKDTKIVPLTYISAQELPNLLPSELASGNILKIDNNSNAVLLTGSEEEIRPILDFIALVDRPLDALQYTRFEIKYLKAKDLMAIIPPKMIPIQPVMIPDSNSFIVLGTSEGLKALRDYIAIVDRKTEGYPIQLRYIKTEDLIKSLPPSISKEDIVDSGFPNLFFFTGSEEKRRLFLRELKSVDRPKPQIRYELLVIQYVNSKALKTEPMASFKPATTGESMNFLGNFANILTLSFDVVNKFGYQFATSLNIKMSENVAEVFADTTLNGLSGQEIKFQNTDTSRYQESEYDEATKKTKMTGVIKEITSGLIVSLNGWVSGDDMITMTVNATVSKQNSGDGSSSGTLPSTSERVINTQVRTPSGEPIIISGLIKDDTNTNIQKIPFLGDIPLLGRLFRTETDTKEKTEIVIYIVPHLSRDGETDQDVSAQLERYYTLFVQGAVK